MTKELIEQVRMGIIPKDEDLEVAIEHYKQLHESLRLHGEIYRLVWRDAHNHYRTLEGYKESRKNRKK